jgi:hypothetical protein
MDEERHGRGKGQVLPGGSGEGPSERLVIELASLRSQGAILAEPNAKYEVVYRETFEAPSPQEAVRLALEAFAKALARVESIEFRVMKWMEDPSAPHAKAYFYLVRSKDLL